MIITEDGTAEFPTSPGKEYIFFASGDISGGSITLQWSDEGEWVNFENGTLTAEGSRTVIAPTAKVRFLTSGTVNPNISAQVLPVEETAGASISASVQVALDQKLDISDKASLADVRAARDDAKYVTAAKVLEMIATHGQAKPPLLPKTQSRWNPTDPLRVVKLGDSFADYGVPAKQMWEYFGYGGVMDASAPGLTGGASLVDGTSLYPGTTVCSIPEGGTATYYGSNASGQILPPTGHVLHVVYVAQNGGGKIKLQYDRSCNEAWTDLAGYTEIDTNNGGTAAPVYLKINLDMADYYRIRVTGLSGTSKVIFAHPLEEYSPISARRGNAVIMRFDQGGSTPTVWLASSAENWNTILGGFDPHLISISSLESLPDWQTYLPVVIARLKVAAPNADIYICSQPPAGYGELPTDNIPNNEWLRDFCQQNEILFVDTHRAFPPRTARTVTDAVTTTGSATLTSATAQFTAADAGRTIEIEGSYLWGDTAIASVTNATTAVLTIPALASGSGLTAHIQDAPPGIYVWPPHLGQRGSDLANQVVWDALAVGLRRPGGIYNGSFNESGILNQVVAGNQLSVVNPRGSGSDTWLYLANSSASIYAYNGAAVGVLAQSGTYTAGALAFKSYDGFITDIWQSGTGRSFHGLQLFFAAQITRDPTAQSEFVALHQGDVPAASFGVAASATANIIELRTGVSVDSGGTLVSAFDANGSLVFKGSAQEIRYAAGNSIRSGTGSPEGVVTAPVGSLFLRTDGGAGSTMYIKESGTGNTGWVAK